MSTPTFCAATVGSCVLSTLPKGVSTFTLPSWVTTWDLLTTLWTMNATVPIPRMPSPMTTATTIRMILSALLPPWAGGAAGIGAAARGAPAGALPTAAAPHLGQNLAPLSIAVPQELQNAISHLAPEFATGAGVYRKSGRQSAGKLAQAQSRVA